VAKTDNIWVLYSYDKRDVLSHQAKVEYVNPAIDMADADKHLEGKNRN
jgi:hypothetical protein